MKIVTGSLLTNSITRTNSMSSLHNVDGELPETLGSIKSVTDSQEAVMSFYYTDAANQVHLWIYNETCMIV